jgi:hypothetical protein
VEDLEGDPAPSPPPFSPEIYYLIPVLVKLKISDLKYLNVLLFLTNGQEPHFEIIISATDYNAVQ